MVSTRLSGNFGGGGESPTAGPEPGPSKSARTSLVQTSICEPSTSVVIVKPAEPKPPPTLLDFPAEILEKIFSYLSFKNVAHLRPVCHKINSICCHILNTTFQRLQGQMLVRFQSIKSRMPRRESARRNHPLACESDIVETLHMRLTLLQMTFGKHIERKHCCFFAGEILDEVYRILHYISVTPVMARPYKVTDELFDLSTMAMEYFKEFIEPKLPEINYFNANFLDFASAYNSEWEGAKSVYSFCYKAFCQDKNQPYLVLDSASTSGSSRTGGDDGHMYGDDPASVVAAAAAAMCFQDDQLSDPPPQSNMVLRKRIRKIKQGMKRYNSQLSLMRRDLRNCKNKIADQQKQILDYAARLDENDKKNEETSRKFSTLLQELNKCKTELQYWRSKSPANLPLCVSCGVAVAPAPPEDLQALANQGALPQGLDLAAVDFVPIAGSVNNPPAPASDSTDAAPQQVPLQQPQPQVQVQQLQLQEPQTQLRQPPMLAGASSASQEAEVATSGAVAGAASPACQAVHVQLATPVACRACPSTTKRKAPGGDTAPELQEEEAAVTPVAVRPGSPSTDDADGSASPKRVRRLSKCRGKRLKVQ
ncbi:F-box only protein 28 isoform X1 [Schistocerca americana]|uniref:F-box only protein 28 isoform X1 n=1 Tax=Schistocerca americana TaxID=7009 RepID=UPI001F4F8D51|nr:F-box only protein 28 isoform X1 [Schistocerca americana]XP_047100607.1 F-box only protein 28 isoform X2 [Schistocerca piceifrons]XP_049946175.1 F-box only protein 28 isoform X1 [Schistocerca serialis cubense]